MKTECALITFGVLLFSNNAFGSACEASSAEEIAQLFGVEASSVQAEVIYERKATSECMWSFTDNDGYGISISYRTSGRPDSVTNPDFFKNGQTYTVENGRKLGSWDLTYRFEEIQNTELGILSDVFGNRYTKSLHYVWLEGEQRRLGVTYNIGANDNGDTQEPTVEDMKKAVAIFTN
ncbi:MAG: hypothetical protein DHS20C11_11120 [Lysobacteraceae bacterium]|nr:MAG: hypothetical protein DHS20C11_11120 [Xanthomonadaceae bacterium]